MKKSNEGAKRRNLVAGSFLVTAAFYFVFSITGYLYVYSDNLTVAVVTGGMYSNNNYCQYVHPLTCILIKIISPLIPSADMFATSVHILLFLAMMSLSYLLLEYQFKKQIGKKNINEYIELTLCILFYTFLILGQNIWGANYTVQTAVLAFAGMIILFADNLCVDSNKWILIGTIFIAAAFMLRMEGALLFLPFAALEIIRKIIAVKGEKKKILKRILPATIIVTALILSKQLFISQEPYASDTKYTESRTIVQDYPMTIEFPWWIDSDRLDKSTYAVIQDWILADTDRITAETLDEAAKIGSHDAFQYNKEGLQQAFHAIYERVMKMDVHLTVFAVTTLLLGAGIIIFAKSKWLKVEAFFALSGGVIILLFYTFKGRALIRVWQCVLLAVCSTLILIYFSSPNDINGNEKIIINGKSNGRRYNISLELYKLILCIILYFGVGQVIAHASVHKPITPLLSKVNADDSVYEITFEEDALYLWPNWYDAIPEYFQTINKLPTQRVLNHNVPLGDWTYGQQYFRDFLKNINAENPALALLERPNTYLVEGMENVLLTYMQDHYGEDIVLEEVGELMDRKVFRMKHSGITGEVE